MKATIYRMKLPEHECPFGVRALERLKADGFDVKEEILATRREVDEFKAKHRVNTTPLIFIDGQRVGGLRELESFMLSEQMG